jgi:hypothetical protein
MVWNCNAKIESRKLTGLARYAFQGGYSDGYFEKPKWTDKTHPQHYDAGYREGQKDRQENAKLKA